MLRLKLQYFGHLLQKTDSFEETLVLGKIEVERRREDRGYAIKTEKGKGLETLFLEVRSKNLPAMKLYSALSFKQISIRKNYYKDPPDDAIIMMRSSEPMVI